MELPEQTKSHEGTDVRKAKMGEGVVNMDLLRFSNPVFNQGENITVRYGIKWAAHGPGAVDLATADGRRLASAKIIKCVMKPFCDITEPEIANEHDPSCRTLEGLHDELCGIYEGFKPNDKVTLVTFTIDSEAMRCAEAEKEATP